MREQKMEIINFYGIPHQLKKLSEEVYEFQETVLLDYGSEECLEHIIEEFADIQVLLDQFKEFYEIDDEKIEENKIKKINRTLERIKNENAEFRKV